MNKEMKKKALLAASVAGLLAVSAIALPSLAMATEGGDKENCYGINACKGTGDCGGKGYSCAGKNSCKGAGFVSLPKGTCTRIVGGSLTPAAQ